MSFDHFVSNLSLYLGENYPQFRLRSEQTSENLCKILIEGRAQELPDDWEPASRAFAALKEIVRQTRAVFPALKVIIYLKVLSVSYGHSAPMPSPHGYI